MRIEVQDFDPVAFPNEVSRTIDVPDAPFGRNQTTSEPKSPSAEELRRDQEIPRFVDEPLFASFCYGIMGIAGTHVHFGKTLRESADVDVNSINDELSRHVHKSVTLPHLNFCHSLGKFERRIESWLNNELRVSINVTPFPVFSYACQPLPKRSCHTTLANKLRSNSRTAIWSDVAPFPSQLHSCEPLGESPCVFKERWNHFPARAVNESVQLAGPNACDSIAEVTDKPVTGRNNNVTIEIDHAASITRQREFREPLTKFKRSTEFWGNNKIPRLVDRAP